MSDVHTKVYLFGTQGTQREIRRAAYPLTQMHAFPNACMMVKGLFGVEAFRLEYEDSERDHVVVDSQEEWEECMRAGPYTLANPLKLFVTKKRPATRATPTSPTAPMPVDKEAGGKGKKRVGSPVSGDASPGPKDKAAAVSDILLRHVDHTEGVAPPPWLAPALKSWQPNGRLVELDVDLDALEACLSRYALSLMDTGDNAAALQLLREAHAVKPTRQNAYNIACSQALLGQSDEAVQALQRAVALGYGDHGHLMADPDLASLHSVPDFIALAAAIAPTPVEMAAALLAAIQLDATSSDPIPAEDGAAGSVDTMADDSTPEPSRLADAGEWEDVPRDEAPRNPDAMPDDQEEKLYKLHELGFTQDAANRRALEASDWNLRKAIDLLLQ